MRSTAWRRLSSSSWVYSRTSPWRSALNPALIDLTAPMLRTTRPNATPRSRSTVIAGSSNAVVTGKEATEVPVDSVMIGSTPVPAGAVNGARPGRLRSGWAGLRRSFPGKPPSTLFKNKSGLKGVNFRQHRDQRVQAGVVPGAGRSQHHGGAAQLGQVAGAGTSI